MSYLEDVTEIASRKMMEHSVVRVGQAYYNALYEYDREQANRINGTSLDPFNDSRQLGAFLEMLRNKGNSIIQT